MTITVYVNSWLEKINTFPANWQASIHQMNVFSLCLLVETIKKSLLSAGKATDRSSLFHPGLTFQHYAIIQTIVSSRAFPFYSMSCGSVMLLHGAESMVGMRQLFQFLTLELDRYVPTLQRISSFNTLGQVTTLMR